MEVIPLLKPSCTQKEIDAVTEVLKSGWWGLGPKTALFEKRFAEYVGVKYAVALNSATAALDLALKAHDIFNGEVIMPALTFVSTGLAAIYNNNRVVFADIDEDTLCMNWADATKKVTKDTMAVMPVWYGGKVNAHFVEDNGIMGMNERAIPIIQDAAHASGNKLAGKHGTACWSFHAVKNLATGDGGMITTNDKTIYERLLPMRWCGIDRSTWERSQKKYGWDYSIESIGYKCHMNDITAAIGLVQLDRLEEMNRSRKLRVLQYLHDLQDVHFIQKPKWDDKSSWHMFVIRIDAKLRDKFIDHMLAHGVSAGVHYKPLNTYSMFPKTKLPVTDSVWKQLVTLPLFADLTDEQFEHIIKTIKSFKA